MRQEKDWKDQLSELKRRLDKMADIYEVPLTDNSGNRENFKIKGKSKLIQAPNTEHILK